MSAHWILFTLAGMLSLGWSLINGVHRRNPKYKQTVIESAIKVPPFSRRRLLRLVAPTRLRDRANHATVIAGCCFIILFPVTVGTILSGVVGWWQAPLIVGAGNLIGAYLGEFTFNSFGCGVDLPAEANRSDSPGEPAR